MENNEIMETAVEEIIETEGSGKGFKVAGAIGVAALAGGLIYKFVAKPLIKKHKAKKELTVELDAEDDDVVDVK